MNGQPWLPAEELLLIAGYEDGMQPAAIAELCRHSLAAVYQKKCILGFPRRYPRHTKSVIAKAKRLFRQGLPDRVIAERLGLSHDQAKHLRSTYCSPRCNPDVDAKRRGVAKQLKTLGLTSPTQLRSRAYRLFAIANGWPDDLRPREVQILNVLARSGVPMTALEIATAIGANTSTTHRTGSRRLILCGNGPGGTYTASLMRRGLVIGLANAGPACKTTGKGCGQRKHLYTLGPLALAILQERACAKQTA